MSPLRARESASTRVDPSVPGTGTCRSASMPLFPPSQSPQYFPAVKNDFRLLSCSRMDQTRHFAIQGYARGRLRVRFVDASSQTRWSVYPLTTDTRAMVTLRCLAHLGTLGGRAGGTAAHKVKAVKKLWCEVAGPAGRSTQQISWYSWSAHTPLIETGALPVLCRAQSSFMTYRR